MLATSSGGAEYGTPHGVWPTDAATARALLGQWQNFDLKAPPAAVNRLSAAVFAAVIAAVGSATLGLRFWCASVVRPQKAVQDIMHLFGSLQSNGTCKQSTATCLPQTDLLALVISSASCRTLRGEHNGISID